MLGHKPDWRLTSSITLIVAWQFRIRQTKCFQYLLTRIHLLRMRYRRYRGCVL